MTIDTETTRPAVGTIVRRRFSRRNEGGEVTAHLNTSSNGCVVHWENGTETIENGYWDIEKI